LPEKPESVPDLIFVEAVRDQVVVELLDRLAGELDHPLSCVINVYKDGRVAGAVDVAGGNRAVGAQHGHVRLRFRATALPNRYLFFVDSLFESDDRTPAFSGFFVRGDVREVGGQVSAKFSSWVVKREDPNWMKWL